MRPVFPKMVLGLGVMMVFTALMLVPFDPVAAYTNSDFPLTADGDSCTPRFVEPTVDVKSEREEPTFSYSESTKDLTQRSTAGGSYRPPGATGPSWHTGGLTQGMFTYKSNIPAKVISSSNGIDCIIVQSISFDIVLTPQVWVANDYAPGTCMYNAVHEHEMKHVNVDRIVTDRHLPQIRAALVSYAQQGGFFGPGTENVVKAQYDHFNQGLLDVIKTQIASMDQEDAKMQQQVDTLQEYERINHLCAKQLQEMAR